MPQESHVQEMQAIVVPRFGGPEVLEARRMPIPKLRPHDVLLRVAATSVNPVDAKIRRNPNPARTLPLAGVTAWGALHDRARIRAGETVLIQAGAGGVGHLAVQFAGLHGCRVLATAGRPESIAFCRDVLQADEVLDYRDVDVPARVRELTGGRGLRAVFDFVGGEVFRQSAECLAPSGHLVTILGADPGAVGQTLLWKNATVHYEFMGTPTLYDLDCAAQGQTLRGIARLADEGHVRPHVSQVLGLDALAEAHRAIETGRTIGKITVRVAPGRSVA